LFTGIIETIGIITHIETDQTNKIFVVESPLAPHLKIDQSIAHSGVCLTVTAHTPTTHTVAAIQETLQKTNLSTWHTGTIVNLERCMPANGRFDGHIVQGHTDQVATCTQKIDLHGSWLFTFEYHPTPAQNITVEKGSICVNGTSLTVVNSLPHAFSVCIIPYTYAHTNFKDISVGSTVNLEFDIIGKYLQKIATMQQ
jgi:riboflavin synthase